MNRMYHLLIVSLEEFQVNLQSNINFSSSFNCRELLKQHEECLTGDNFVSIAEEITNTTTQSVILKGRQFRPITTNVRVSTSSDQSTWVS